MEIKPIFFVVPGAEVFVKYENEDGELEYFQGTVEKINYFCDDEHGSYVNCHIKYVDESQDTNLYNHDFENPNSEDAWKLGPQISLIVKYLVSSHNDVEYLKENLVETEDYDSEDEVPPPPSRFSFLNAITATIKLFVPFGLAYFFRQEICAIAQ